MAPFSRMCSDSCCNASKCGHHVASEHAQLLDPLLRGHTFWPVQDDLLQSRILIFQLFQTRDDGRWWTNQPGFLANALLQLGHAGRRAGCAPWSAVLVRVAHEAEGGEPLVTLVVVRLH